MVTHVFHSGTSVRRTALGLALGLVLGVMPVIWGTSVLCFLVAWALRLNHILIQGVNYLLYPVHLGLLWPFFHCSAVVFEHSAPLDATTLNHIKTPSLDLISAIWRANMYALLLWFILAIICLPPLYFTLVVILKRFQKR